MGTIAIVTLITVLFVLLLILGVNVSTVLIISGALGIYLLVGIAPVISLLQLDTYSTVASYTLTTIPLFVLMSQFIIQADIVKYLYSLVFKLSKGKSSMLGIFTVILGGFLGAVSGSASAMSAALGQFAVPELKKHGYSENLSAAIAAVSGSLSTIIPPSIGLIVYGAITQTSISSLFMAIIIPGLLTLIVVALTVLFYYNKEKKVNPSEDALDAEETTIVYEKKEYAISIITGLLIMGAIFGGIYSGIFTPTEAGGVGAFITFIAAILLGKFSGSFLVSSLTNTAKISSMVLLIMVGATIFTRFVTLSQLPKQLIDAIEPLLQYELLVIVILLAIFFVFFMFLEGSAAIVMLVPITLPIAQSIGYSPLEFGVLISVVGTAGLLTPPVGLSAYSVSGVTRIPVDQIFKYTFTFAVVITIAVSAVLIMFPILINWLPNSM